MKTKDRKLKVKDTVYIFRVPSETSLDPVDIIKSGKIMMIKVGAMPGKDVKGNLLGITGRAWNPQKAIEVEETPDIHWLIKDSIQRTKDVIEAEEKCPGTKLPRLAVTKHRGEVIRIAETEPRFYYIPSKTYCANCTELILGITKLEINSNGKVCKELPFEPSDNAVQCTNGSKKWLHPNCAAKHITPENLTLQDVVKAGTAAGVHFNFGLEHEKQTVSPEQLLNTILTDQDIYSADFARGASMMFMCCKQLK